MLRAFFQRLVATLRPGKSEQRLAEEIGEHLDELQARAVERGLADGEAHHAARRDFGSIEVTKEQYRDQARFRNLEKIAQDLRFALRQHRKNPGFAAAAVMSLALGIGANAALFSFVNAVLLRQLPVPRPEQLAVLKNAGKPVILTYEQLKALNGEATETDGIAGTHPWDVSVMLGDHPQWVSAELVTGEYFRTLQVKPERGRLLNQRDLDEAQGDPRCVISYRFWKAELGGAEDAIGRNIYLNARRYRVIGVSQRGFTGTDLARPSDLQIPATRLIDYMPAFVGLPHYDWKSRLWLFSAMARLRPGATREAAAGELTRLNRAYLKAAKVNRPTTDIQLADGSAGIASSNLAKPASILLAVSGVVLLIACANLATLLLSRTSARSGEFALRLALGSSQKRLIAQVLVESAQLAVFGTAAGLAVAFAIKEVLLKFLNRTAPHIHQLQIAMDGRVLGFVAVVSVVCVLLFGAAPAIQAARTAALGSSAGNTRGGVTVRKAFVVAQIALSFVVVLAAGLLARTLRNVTAVDLGFRPDEIAAVDIRPAAGGYTGARADEFYTRLVERARALPGVRASATGIGTDFLAPSKMKLEAPAGPAREVSIVGVSPGYFETMGARILAGRDFNAGDTGNKPQVYIISEHLARTYFHGEDPIGRYLWHDAGRVVGVVSDMRAQGPRAPDVDTVYQDAGQLLASNLTLFVRCNGPCAPLLPTLRTAIRAVDPNTPILAIHTLKAEIEGSFSSQEVLAFLSTLFAGLAMLLVAAGIYGVLSYALTRRTREMGIRIALGASGKNIAALFISETAVMVAIGTAIGMPGARAAVTLLQSQLFGVEAHDWKMLVGTLMCVTVTIAVASVPPIRRALRIAPQQALRTE